jgi:protein PhnA
MSKDIKMGTVVKNIRLTDDDEMIEGKVDGTMVALKTIFLKKK